MFNSLLLLFAVTNGISAASTYRAAAEEMPPVVFQVPAELVGNDGNRLTEAPEKGGGTKDVNKREVGDNVAEFVLRVNPVIPRNPMSLKNFSDLNCVGKKNWCVEEPTTPIPLCPPEDTFPPQPTTCGPSKPSFNAPKRTTICNIQRSDFPTPRDPCDECHTPKPCSSTPFMACQSVPPPTKAEKLIYCSPTMVAMHPPCTYMTPAERSTKPLPVCDKAPPAEVKGQQEVAVDENAHPVEVKHSGAVDIKAPQVGLKTQKSAATDDKYYILVKRSPKGRKRKKREYRPVLFISPASGQPMNGAYRSHLM